MVAGHPFPLVTLTVTVEEPTVVGVPESRPLDESVRPGRQGATHTAE